MSIFSRDSDNVNFIADLKALAVTTKDSHTLHDYRFQSWGKAIMTKGTHEGTEGTVGWVSIFSPEEIKNGDLIMTNSNLIFAFDVQKNDNPGDLYTFNAVTNSPSTGIGHAAKADERRRSSTLSVSQTAAAEGVVVPFKTFSLKNAFNKVAAFFSPPQAPKARSWDI